MTKQKCASREMLLPYQQCQPYLYMPNHYFLLNQCELVFFFFFFFFNVMYVVGSIICSIHCILPVISRII
jgi:hypothetical protein